MPNNNSKSIKFIVILLLFTTCSYNSIFGNPKILSNDTVHIPVGYLLVLQDTTFQFQNDTTLIISNENKYKIKKEGSDFYTDFEDKSDSNIIVKGLYDIMIRKQADTTAIVEDPNKQKLENYNPEFENKKVGSITIVTVPLIDGDVNDLTHQTASTLSRSLDKLHPNTRTSIIRKNLTFKEGDKLGAYTLTDSEHLLRDLSAIEDAKIFATPDSLNPEVLNLIVAIKDIFPIAIGFSMSSLSNFKLGLNDVNLLGYGHEFRNSFRYNTAHSPTIGYEGELKFTNLWGSFTDASIFYINNYKEEVYKLNLYKDFLTPETKYGGGFEFFNQQTTIDLPDSDTTYITVPYTKNYTDTWLARSFLLDDVTRKSFVVKGRVMRTNYFERPLVEADSNQQFYNSNLLLGSVGLVKVNYFKERMLLGYGLIEDISFGYAFELTYGWRFGEYLNAPYLGLSYKTAQKYDFGFLGGGAEYGTFIYKNEPVLGLFRSQVSYYTPLLKNRLFQYRFITRSSYVQGINRYSYEILNLGKEVRGISNSGIEGNQRLVSRFELVTFLKPSPLGFKFSPNIFYDAALINSNSDLLSSNSYYSGIGVGVRIRNEHLAFQTLILRLVYYTKNPVKSAYFGIGVSTSNPDIFKEYDITKPNVLEY